MVGFNEGSMRAAKDKEKVQVLDGSNGSLQPEKLGVDGVYGTQKQTIVLVDRGDRVRFFERTLYDQNAESIPPGQGDVDVEYQIGT